MSKPQMTEQERRTALRQLWQGSTAITAGDPVARYLAGRGIALTSWPTSLRCCPQCPVSVRKSARDPRRLPAMIALVVGPDGKGASLHRTYLARDGSGKANMETPRLLMPGTLPEGVCIRLCGIAPVIGLAEGIETAMAASLLFRVPVWATINANLMAKWIPPEGVEDVAIFADNDANFHGQYAAYSLAHRLAQQGLNATVNVPPVVGKDWNDVLLEERARGGNREKEEAA
jgi:putative DNA primase/helicase